MNVRPINIVKRGQTTRRRPFARNKALKVLVLFLAMVTSLSWLMIGVSTASASGAPIKSGWSGYCLDNHDSNLTSGNPVDLWSCNKTAAQDWQLSLTQIKYDNKYCLTAGQQLTIEDCNDGANQVWLRDDSGFLSPLNEECLSADKALSGESLSLAGCSKAPTASQTWQVNMNYATYLCSGGQGQKVACNAIKQWVAWTSEPNNHEALLNTYTGGAPYEEWCADFVSYIFQQAGYPFSNGNYDGWDENLAPAIINQGFKEYQPGGNFNPKPGDVAYFTYLSGHVEIVVSGGKTPTFIYGNSATTDPTTGNGDMAANTVTSVKGLGYLQYYMVPTGST